jgi:hypothetical protein
VIALRFDDPLDSLATVAAQLQQRRDPSPTLVARALIREQLLS